MAGINHNAERKAKAVAQIEQFASALVAHYKLEIAPLKTTKSPEYAELDRLDYAAAVLKAVMDAANADHVKLREAAAQIEGLQKSITAMESALVAMKDEAAGVAAQGEPANPDDPQVIAKLASKTKGGKDDK